MLDIFKTLLNMAIVRNFEGHAMLGQTFPLGIGRGVYYLKRISYALSTATCC